MSFFIQSPARTMLSFLLAFSILMLVSCAGRNESHTTAPANVQEEGAKNRLNIGVSTNYPPLVFKEGGRFQGVEIEFAHMLARELGRNVRAINIPWEKQIPYLLQGKTDVIMSGMSITPERAIRIAFTSPYLVTGLVAAIRNSDRELFRTKNDIMNKNIAIGVIRGTVGEKYARRNLTKASRIILFEQADHAAVALVNRTISVFIHDAPAVMWTVSKHAEDICGIWEPLNREEIAWGVRKGDGELLAQLNSIIEKWRKDGTIDEVINRWLPYKLEEN